MSLWTAEMQPRFNNWEAVRPVDDFYAGEERFEQWYLDFLAQEESRAHFLGLLRALNHHLRSPSPPRCLARDAESAYPTTPTPSTRGTPLQDFSEMRAAIGGVGGRRRAHTI